METKRIKYQKGPLSGLLTLILTPGTFLLAWAIGVNLRDGELFRAIEFAILTIAAAWLWFWIRSWPE